MTSGLSLPDIECLYGLLSKQDERLVSTRSDSLHHREEDASPPPGAARITSGCCAVSICLGARIICGWCPPSLGIRSGPKVRSGWFPRPLALVGRNASPLRVNPPAPAGSNDHKLLPHSGCQRSFGSRKMTSGWCTWAMGIRSGARVKRGRCFWLLHSFGRLVPAQPAGAKITNG